MPIVSVVVPTYNRPEMLRDALESLTVQCGVSFDVAVVNDAGVEVSEIVSLFEEKLKLCYFRLPVNRGLPAARNFGIERTTGRFVAYLDDDDIYLPGHLEELVTRLEEKQELGLVYSDALLERHLTCGNGTVMVEERVLAQEYDATLMLSDSFICPSAIMHRRECIERVGGFDEAMRWCYEDWDFLLKIGRQYEIERVAGATVKVRLRDDGSNMSSRGNDYRTRAATALRERYGCGEIEPKTFWEVAATLAITG